MPAVGVNQKGFDRLLSILFYTQIVCAQFEYGLAISSIPAAQLTKLGVSQTQCIRQIFGGGSRSSIKAMLHLVNRALYEGVCTSSAPLLMIPITHAERSRLLRWRLGWLPGGAPKPCIYHPHIMLTRTHAMRRLHMRLRLQMAQTEPDPLSFLLNRLPNKKTTGF